MTSLSGKVCLVAGATRGAGRGIAVALGEQGATVYCSGRSVDGAVATAGRTETIDGTARLVAAAGGQGIAVRCDHTKEDEVQALMDRIAATHGRLDVLVNDVWGGDRLVAWQKPFWEAPADDLRRLLDQAVVSHVLTTQKAVPLLGQGSLVVEVTDGDSFAYRGNLFYDLVKTMVIRLAFAWHEELQARGVSAVAVTPGFLRSEAMLDLFGVTEATWREHGAKDPDFLHSETPLFVGRGVAALAADPHIARRSGRVVASWTLAREYGFTDADGSRPDWGAHVRARYGDVFRPLDDAAYASWEGWARLKAQVQLPA